MPENGTSRNIVGGKPRQSPRMPCVCITVRIAVFISEYVIFFDCILVRINSTGLTKVTAQIRAVTPDKSGISKGISRPYEGFLTFAKYLW